MTYKPQYNPHAYGRREYTMMIRKQNGNDELKEFFKCIIGAFFFPLPLVIALLIYLTH